MYGVGGVTNFTRDFASDYKEIEQCKFQVDYSCEEGTRISYMEYVNNKWTTRESITISTSCDELLFRTIAKDFESGIVTDIRIQ